MKTLVQIKNLYAIDLGYKCWESLMTEVCCFSNEEFFHHENEVIVLVQKEYLKNASSNFLGASHFAVDTRSTITNENNIIK